MLRYIAVAWDDTHEGQSAAAHLLLTRLRALPRRWMVAVAVPGLQVLHDGARAGSFEAHLLPRSAGVIFGTVFEAHAGDAAPRRKRTFSITDTDRILASGARTLVADYWGRYVAIAHDAAQRRTFVMRDPTGGLPCFQASFQGAYLFFSSAEDCAALGLLDLPVDWEFIARHVAWEASGPRHTAIKNIDCVQGGEQLQLQHGTLTRATAWDAMQVAQTDPLHDAAAAATLLRSVARNVVHAWASCHHGVLHSLSGGLDSSIVLGCLRDGHGPPAVTCLNYHSRSAEGDERYFARLAAHHANFPLLEWERDSAVRLDDLRTLERSPTPRNYLNWLQVSRREARLAREISASAIFSGDGGDELFYRTQGILGAADFLRDHGVNRRFIEVALDAAHLEDCSLWHVISEAFRHRRDQVDAPLGKRWHCASLRAPQDGLDPFITPQHPERVQPLLSQPLIELCLRIPTYLLAGKGWDRAVARQAFGDDVPREIVRRRAKSGVNENILDVFKRNYEGVRELLLDGELVGAQLLDRTALEHALASANHDRARAHQMFEYLSTDAWLRSWKWPAQQRTS